MPSALRLAPLLAALLASPVAGQGLVTEPDWLRRPSGEDMADAYPMIGQVLEIEGRAVIACAVSTAGLLEGCSVVEEAPAAIGFGAASLELSRLFRMRPLSRDGEPVTGGTVRIPIAFRLPPPRPDPPTAGVPPTAAALAAGRAIVDGLEVIPAAQAHYEARAQTLITTTQTAAAEADRRAAAEALRAAVGARMPELREAYAAAFARALSEAELTALAQEAGTPGRAVWRPGQAREALEQDLHGEFLRRAAPVARAAFCAKHACAPRGSAFLPRADDPIWEPIWADRPNPGAVIAATPMVAKLMGLGGQVRLRCRVTRNGVLEDCRAVAEAPAGLGFAAAAVRLSQAYRLSPTQAAGGAAGQTMGLDIVFPALIPRAAYAPRKGASRAARAAAEAYVAAAYPDPPFSEAQLATMLGERPQGADAAAYADALAAVRQGFAQATAEIQALRADAYAAEFAAEELTAAAAFARTPSGLALRRAGPTLGPALNTAYQQWHARILAEARTAYCRGRPCGQPQPSGASSAPSTRTP
ncbi:TonB family protein [Phenylobacterium sp.]|uniref:TonB family protein n=1 Tax=Phenylobacterium sp. TaxID=1871053 RepID=UPI0035B4B97D